MKINQQEKMFVNMYGKLNMDSLAFRNEQYVKITSNDIKDITIKILEGLKSTKSKSEILSECYKRLDMLDDELPLLYSSGDIFTGSLTEILEHYNNSRDHNVFGKLYIQLLVAKIMNNIVDVYLDENPNFHFVNNVPFIEIPMERLVTTMCLYRQFRYEEIIQNSLKNINAEIQESKNLINELKELPSQCYTSDISVKQYVQKLKNSTNNTKYFIANKILQHQNYIENLSRGLDKWKNIILQDSNPPYKGHFESPSEQLVRIHETLVSRVEMYSKDLATFFKNASLSLDQCRADLKNFDYEPIKQEYIKKIEQEQKLKNSNSQEQKPGSEDKILSNTDQNRQKIFDDSEELNIDDLKLVNKKISNQSYVTKFTGSSGETIQTQQTNKAVCEAGINISNRARNDMLKELKKQNGKYPDQNYLNITKNGKNQVYKLIDGQEINKKSVNLTVQDTFESRLEVKPLYLIKSQNNVTIGYFGLDSVCYPDSKAAATKKLNNIIANASVLQDSKQGGQGLVRVDEGYKIKVQNDSSRPFAGEPVGKINDIPVYLFEEILKNKVNTNKAIYNKNGQQTHVKCESFTLKDVIQKIQLEQQKNDFNDNVSMISFAPEATKYTMKFEHVEQNSNESINKKALETFQKQDWTFNQLQQIMNQENELFDGNNQVNNQILGKDRVDDPFEESKE